MNWRNPVNHEKETGVEISRWTAMVIGVLLIAAMVSGVFSSVPTIEEPDYLMKLPSIESRVLIAVFFQASMAVIYMAITAITYPLVKRAYPKAALAYYAFRTTGGAFLFIGIVTLLLLLALGRQYLQTDAVDLISIEIIGTLLRHTRDWLNHIGMILPWSIGGIFLYSSFLKTRLIPGWMAIWGLVATALTLTVTILYMLDRIKLVTIAYFALNAPTAFLELVLAVYLITCGFSKPSASLTGSQRKGNVQ